MTTVPRIALQEFHAHVLESGRSEATARAYRSDMIAALDWIEERGVSVKTLPDLFRSWLAESAIGKSPSTVRRRKASASEFLKFLEVDHKINFKLPPAPPPDPHPLPGGRASVERMLAHASDTDDVMLVALGGLMGLRVSESCSITADNYDELKRTLTVRGKGHKFRILPATDQMHDIIMRSIHENRYMDGPLVQMSNSSARARITKIAERAGFRGVSSHDLRATFATEMHNQTKDVLMVQNWLGHASPETTRRYVQTTVSAMRMAAL